MHLNNRSGHNLLLGGSLLGRGCRSLGFGGSLHGFGRLGSRALALTLTFTSGASGTLGASGTSGTSSTTGASGASGASGTLGASTTCTCTRVVDNLQEKVIQTTLVEASALNLQFNFFA